MKFAVGMLIVMGIIAAVIVAFFVREPSASAPATQTDEQKVRTLVEDFGKKL